MSTRYMVSTIMYLMNRLPDWNSLDSVRRAHSHLELWSILFFGLLAGAEAIAHKLGEGKTKNNIDTVGIVFFIIAVVCEGVAYPYGQRNDELSDQVIGSLDKRDRDAKDMADAAVASAKNATDSASAAEKVAGKASLTVTAVGKQADEIDQRLGMAQYFLSDRDIRDPNGLKAKLSKFAGKTILFRSYVNDGDGYFVCKELDWLAGSAGVVATDQCGLFPVEPPYPMTQINVFAPDDETMLSLVAIMAGATFGGASSGPAGNAPHATAIIVFVGRKNRAFAGETAQARDAEKRAAAMKKATARP